MLIGIFTYCNIYIYIYMSIYMITAVASVNTSIKSRNFHFFSESRHEEVKTWTVSN